jgi:serine/threonine-protein kinase
MRATATLSDYIAALHDKGVDENALTVDSNGTVVVSLPPELQDIPALARLTQAGGDIELLQPIAKGGMGVIHLARQKGMGREVAVKQAHADETGSRDPTELAAELLVEARVTGSLEHPNIVPIYTIGEDDDGNLLLVMKRIEGRSWSTLMRNRRGQPGAREAEIRVLLEVAQATHFAHEKGVIHRDLKPDNVMIGLFDEVYVLDWGIALATRTPAPAGLRVADGKQPIAGTPSYMAPEMSVPFEKLDRRTDVFLLGSILHEIVTGAPPYKGVKRIPELLYQAHRCETFEYDDAVPDELVAICRRAMARDPNDRYATANDLRLALEDFLQHASARELAALAHESLDALRSLSDEDGDDIAAQRAFAEARFGFKQALRAWPAPSAKDGMREAVTLMCDRELRRGRADAAALLLEDTDVTGELRERVNKLREEKARRDSELESLARDVDPLIGQRGRAWLIFGLGVVWFFHQLGLRVALDRGWVESAERFLFLSNGAAVLPLVGIGTAVVVVQRQTNALNRKVYIVTCAGQLMSALTFLLAMRVGFDYAAALVFVHMIITLCVVAAGLLDRRILYGLWGAIPGMIFVPFFPGRALELNGFWAFVTFSLVAWAMNTRAAR